MKNESYIKLWGPIQQYSPGTAVIMADRQIKRAIEKNTVCIDEIGNTKAVVKCKDTQKWFFISGGWGNNDVHTAMLGVACGDVAGSVYEWHNIKYKPDKNSLIQPYAKFTDDTVMTCAVANGIRTGLSLLPSDWINITESEDILLSSIKKNLLFYGRKYPYAGYGGAFKRWLKSNQQQAYNSWGNGSAMRASYAGWIASTLKEAEKFYDMEFTLDGIRETYEFDVSCMGSVPQAIKAFLEGNDFADVLSSAISIGGDSDTIATIAGSLAEVIYPIPQGVRGRVIDRMDEFLLNTIVEAVDFMYQRLPE